MGEDEIFHLYDSFWFERVILSKNSVPPHHTEPPPYDQTLEIEEQDLSRPRLLRLRSRSDHDLSAATSFLSDSFSPNSVLATRKLQTIVSGKEACDSKEGEGVVEEAPARKREKERRRTKGRGYSRSLSDLEFEELKGFMDLGFVFTEEDKKDSSLASIIPGLQRLGRTEGEDQDDGSEDRDEKSVDVSRPYLSEAWDVMGERKVENPLLTNWRVPALVNEVDIKDQLRFWAHSVASTVI